MRNTQQSQMAIKEASLHFGIFGTLAFIVFILIFREDWTDKFHYMIYLLPLPVIALLTAKRFPLLGGVLMIALGIGVTIFDVSFSPSHPGQIAGRGLGYSLIFVVFPLAASGIFYLILWWKNR